MKNVDNGDVHYLSTPNYPRSDEIKNALPCRLGGMGALEFLPFLSRGCAYDNPSCRGRRPRRPVFCHEVTFTQTREEQAPPLRRKNIPHAPRRHPRTSIPLGFFALLKLRSRMTARGCDVKDLVGRIIYALI